MNCKLVSRLRPKPNNNNKKKYVATNNILLFLHKRVSALPFLPTLRTPQDGNPCSTSLICTVVGNPRGSWGFGKILLKGVLGVVKKCSGSLFSCLLHFYDTTFQILPPPPPPPCASVALHPSFAASPS
jgi:hypothetical protein